MQIARPLYLAVGWLSAALAGIGVVVPLLPTTPFLLVAVWAFSKSSPQLAARIRGHKTFGPYIRDWQDHGAIPLSAKVLAVVMMAVAGVTLVSFGNAPTWLDIVVCGALALVAVYVVSRPTRRGP